MKCNCKNDNEIDACLGFLNGIMNAYCGHNGYTRSYVQLLDGSVVSGNDALIMQEILKRQPKDLLRYKNIKDTRISEFEIGQYKDELLDAMCISNSEVEDD